MIVPPPLPPRLTRMSTVVGVGTAVWVLAAGVALLAGAPAVVLLTCLAGVGLGAVGWAIFRWQRAAVRRGSRTAQRGIES